MVASPTTYRFFPSALGATDSAVLNALVVALMSVQPVTAEPEMQSANARLPSTTLRVRWTTDPEPPAYRWCSSLPNLSVSSEPIDVVVGVTGPQPAVVGTLVMQSANVSTPVSASRLR